MAYSLESGTERIVQAYRDAYGVEPPQALKDQWFSDLNAINIGAGKGKWAEGKKQTQISNYIGSKSAELVRGGQVAAEAKRIEALPAEMQAEYMKLVPEMFEQQAGDIQSQLAGTGLLQSGAYGASMARALRGLGEEGARIKTEGMGRFLPIAGELRSRGTAIGAGEGSTALERALAIRKEPSSWQKIVQAAGKALPGIATGVASALVPGAAPLIAAASQAGKLSADYESPQPGPSLEALYPYLAKKKKWFE